MTCRHAFFVAFCFVSIPLFATTPVFANQNQALRTVMHLAAGAEALSRGIESIEQYWAADEVSAKLETQDHCKDAAIYSVFFHTTAGYWADVWSRPDVFFCLDIEGKGTFVAPNIQWNYSGTPFLDHVLAEETPAGSRIVVRVMDDDSVSDEVWNNILSSRINIQLTAEFSVTRFIPVRAITSGSLKLLDRPLTIDAPELIATAVFEVPDSKEGVWLADGQLLDSNHNPVGTIQMSCIWSSRRDREKQSDVVKRFRKSSVFWLVLGGGLILLFLRGVFESGENKTTSH